MDTFLLLPRATFSFKYFNLVVALYLNLFAFTVAFKFKTLIVSDLVKQVSEKNSESLLEEIMNILSHRYKTINFENIDKLIVLHIKRSTLFFSHNAQRVQARSATPMRFRRVLRFFLMMLYFQMNERTEKVCRKGK